MLEANRVKLWHISVLEVVRGAELKSVVCQAQKRPIMPKNLEIKDGRHIHIFITKLGRNLNKMCFSGF